MPTSPARVMITVIRCTLLDNWRPSRGSITFNEVLNDSEGGEHKLQYAGTGGIGNSDFGGEKYQIKSSVCRRLGGCEQRRFPMLETTEVNTHQDVYPTWCFIG